MTNVRFVAKTQKHIRDYPIDDAPYRHGYAVVTPFGRRVLHGSGKRWFIYLPGGGMQFGVLRVKAGRE